MKRKRGLIRGIKREKSGISVLTAREMVAVIIPAFNGADMYFGSKFKSLMDGGFIPFFKSPTCITTLLKFDENKVKFYFIFIQ